MKTKIYLFALLLMCSGLAGTTRAAAKETTKEQTEMRISQIKTRVDEIKAMDLEHLSKADRVSVRHELKGMNKELRSMSPYIYISAGALILIIILILLLL